MRREMRLKRVARVVVSNVDKKSVPGERSVRLCNYTDVYYNDRITADLEFMRATATGSQIADFRLLRGDVLITKDSETPDDIAVPALVDESADDLLCGYHLARIRPERTVVDPHYLFWTLASSSARSWFATQATGVTRFGLRTQSIADARLSLPSLHEQREIADYLDAEAARIDALIAKKWRMMALVEVRWQVLVRNRLNAVSPSLPLKRRWRVIDCKHRTPAYVDEGYPVVSPGDLTAGRLDLSVCHRFVDEVDFVDLTEDRRPAKGDIIYSRNASAGIAAYVDTDEAFCMGQDVCLITSVAEDQRFLMYALNTIGADQLAPIKIGSTITRINVDQIGELRVPIPAPDIQRRIGDELDAQRARLDALIQRIRRQIDLLRERRQVLITAAVTGQLEIASATR